jgi:ATP-grasp domain/L-amino acid ligase C-terminal domain 2
MPRILLLSTTTGYQAQQFRDAATRLGYALALASDSCHALDDPWGDGAISVRFQKPQASAGKIGEFALHQTIDGVVAIGDAPVMTAALVARELGIEFHPPEAVEASRNKFLARERFKAARMRVPWFQRFKAISDPAMAARAAPYPCVLKPLGLSASRGVIRADNERRFAEAFTRIRRLLQSGDVKVMREESAGWIQVESYIPGREFAVEGMVTRGRLRPLAIFDKPDPLEGPFFEETIYVTPSRLSAGEQHAVVECTEQAVAALGLRHGPIHAELRLNEWGPWMLEVAARPIGGLCAGALRFQDDGRLISLEELILRHAAGENVDALPREIQASGVMMIPISEAGFFEGVEGLDAAERTHGVERIEITAKLRQKLVPLPEGASYLGFIFARGDTPEFVENALREAYAKLRFLVSAEIPVV